MTEPYRERFSTLKHMAKSPAHYWHARNNAFEQTAAMRFGSLVHALVLGGYYAVFEGATRRGKEWDAFQLANAGKLIVKSDELASAKQVAHAVMTDPVAAPLLVGEHEKYIEWEHMGRPFRSTLDVLGKTWIADLKTTTNASPELFAYHARRMNYHAQMATYAEAVGGMPSTGAWIDCYLLAVEINPPHGVTVHRLTPRAIDMGRRSLALWHERVRQCEDEGVWPGYCQSVIDLDVEADVELTFGEDVLE
jgi:hypothetical protein